MVIILSQQRIEYLRIRVMGGMGQQCPKERDKRMRQIYQSSIVT